MHAAMPAAVTAAMTRAFTGTSDVKGRDHGPLGRRGAVLVASAGLDAGDLAALLLDLLLHLAAELAERREREERDDADDDHVLDHVGAGVVLDESAGLAAKAGEKLLHDGLPPGAQRF